MNILQNFKNPIDANFILRKKKFLKKEMLKNENFLVKKIAILGGSTTSEVRNILELFLLSNGIRPDFYESEYNRFYEDSLFDNGELDKFNPDIVYIHTTNINIGKQRYINRSHKQNFKQEIKDEIDKFRSIWNALNKYDCDIIQNNFDLPLNRSRGSLDCYSEHGEVYFINQLNLEFSKNAKEINNLHINDINYLSSYIGLQNWFDRSLWYRAKYAISMESIPELAFSVSKIINTIVGKGKKCLILDLDNTCWGGCIGDDGLSGIDIGTETATSEAFTDFQKYVKELNSTGIILAVCSKNDFNNAKTGFSHPDCILKYEDFSSFKANWDNKHDNVISIGNEINIGLDSLVFIDDNPMERDIVSSQLADVQVPNVGSEVVNFIEHIDRNGYFESISLSDEDLSRHKFYENNKKSLRSKSKYKSYDTFLKSLNMRAEIRSFNLIYLNRIFQLVNKTNQFNLATKRYSIGEIENILSSKGYVKIYGKLFDKYGSNGVVSIIIGRIEDNICHIETFLMSCRVLKREMEFAMFNEFIKHCKKIKLKKVIGYYYKSAKNSMVDDLYVKLGLNVVSVNKEEGVWNLSLSKYKEKKCHIIIDREVINERE